MYKFKSYQYSIALSACLMVAGCKAPAPETTTTSTPVPESFGTTTQIQDANNNTATLAWKDYFKDQNLVELIDVALKNNQELNITLQEIEIARNDIRVKKGLLLPTVGVRAGAGVEKVGRYTSQGAGDANTDIKPGVKTPDPLGDFILRFFYLLKNSKFHTF